MPSTAQTAPHQATALLRAAGLRVTGQRLAVYDEVVRRPHADADSIAVATRAVLGRISTQAVYDVLRALTATGLVRRIEPAGSPARYEARVGDNHHHLVCRRCGALGDVDCAVGSAPCLKPVADAGFTVDEAEVTYWGLCAACTAAASDGITPTTSPPLHGGAS